MNNKILLFVIGIISTCNSYGQVDRQSLIGKYEPQKTNDQIPSIDTVEIQDGSLHIISVTAFGINEFPSRTLILKRFKRIKIIDNSPITTYGYNIDNPTLYGKFKIVGDSIVIEVKYSIQHFSSSGPNKRIKTKLDRTYTFKIIDENQLMINPNYSWIKITSKTKDKHH